MTKIKSLILTLVALMATAGAWADKKVFFPEGSIVYDFEAAANAGENPANKNGSAANGQLFYGWENGDDKKDKARQDYKGYEWAEGSVLPEVCHVWRRSDRINGNVAGNGGLKCPSDKEMAVDGLVAGDRVVIVYDATNASDQHKNIIWATGDGTSDGGPGTVRATATINGVEAVTGQSVIPSGALIQVNKVTPAENGSGYIVFKVFKDMVIKQIVVIPAGIVFPVEPEDLEVTWDNATKTATIASMPAGDVELEIVYKTQSQLVLTFNNAEIPTDGLTGYLGFEDEFAGSLGFAIDGLDAAMGFTFESDNTQVMAFGDDNAATGVLQDIKFLAVGEANLTVKFAGTDDYSTAEATVPVTVKEKFWTVTLNDGDVDTQNWTITPAEATTDGVHAGTEVKATYNGQKKVKSVKAVVTGAAPAAEAATIYSWESPEGTVNQTGGTIAYVNGDTSGGDRVNYLHIETNNYTICLNGKKNNITDGTASQNAGRMDVTLDEALAAGDVITITAYIYKDESKQSSAYIIFNGANGFDSSYMSVYAESAAYGDNENLYSSFNGSPKTVTVTVPAEAAGCKSFSMTRGITGTNLFITKMTITRGVANN